MFPKLNWKEQSSIKKALIILVIVVILLLLILCVAFLILPKPEQSQQIPTPDTIQLPVSNQGSTPVSPIAVQEQITIQERERDVRIIAEPFIERFGSYNNQDDLQNLNELEEFMAPSLSLWVNNTYKIQLRKELPNIDTYYAINTKVLSSEITNIDRDLGQAEIIMTTQRQEVGEFGIQSSLNYQEVRVTLILINEAWKVDGVYWQ